MLLSICVMISILIFRLFWIQIISTHHLTMAQQDLVERSVGQRGQSLLLNDGRAHFYDRYMRPLTGKKIYALAIFPLNKEVRSGKEGSEKLRELAHILDTPFATFCEYINGLRQPMLWHGNADKPVALTERQAEEINALEMPGIRAVDFHLRYAEPYIASHLIGFVAQQPDRLNDHYKDRLLNRQLALHSKVGAAGLEYALDHYLLGRTSTSLTLFTDAHYKPLHGLSMRLKEATDPAYPLKVKTTLDQEIQAQVESIMDEAGVTVGSIVVLDANTADVIAMASRPQFNPYDVDPHSSYWANKAIKAFTPGSIFKTVVAAAALEGKYVGLRETIACEGSLGKYHLNCWKKGGHGRLTLEEAYVQSCNVVFAKVMERIPSAVLEQTARKLGLMQKNGWTGTYAERMISQFAGEESGRIFATDVLKYDGGARAQTAIGQRDVALTPLQAANMVVTLLHDGKVHQPRVVQDIRYANDRLYDTFHQQLLLARSEGISARTARTLRHWMERVVTDGTGQSLRQQPWLLAGKSGTAQVKVQGVDKYNQWFIGYGPVEKPRYAVAVMVQNNASHHQGTYIFAEVMQLLLL